jgi:mono/diheme cytochrome c family protein
VDNACSKCHGIKKVESASKNASEWEATLDRMIKKGAKVTPEERDAILKYLNTLNK